MKLVMVVKILVVVLLEVLVIFVVVVVFERGNKSVHSNKNKLYINKPQVSPLKPEM